jgi:hypothetical protein
VYGIRQISIQLIIIIICASLNARSLESIMPDSNSGIGEMANDGLCGDLLRA